MERMGWTWDELAEAPHDVVVALREKWAAQAEAGRIRGVNGR